MPFSKCLRANIYRNMNVYFDPQGCQTLLLKENEPLLFSLGSRTAEMSVAIKVKHWKYIWSVLKNFVLVSQTFSVNNKLLVVLVL